MEKNTNKKSASALIGAAFLMATSAIGPGFLTQTGQFTGNLKGSFGFVILVSVILAAIVQLNVWRVLCVSGMRGQDVANKVLPGLGYVIAFLVVAGDLYSTLVTLAAVPSDSTACLASRLHMAASSQEQSQSVYSFTKMH